MSSDSHNPSGRPPLPPAPGSAARAGAPGSGPPDASRSPATPVPAATAAASAWARAPRASSAAEAPTRQRTARGAADAPAPPGGGAPPPGPPPAPGGGAPPRERPVAPGGGAPPRGRPAPLAGGSPPRERPAAPGGDAPPRQRPAAPEEPYRRYRARPRLRLPGRRDELGLGGAVRPARRRITWRRALGGLGLLLVGWVALSAILFLISSHFERIAPPSDVAAALDPGGPLPFSANNVLVLGSDQRPTGSKEGGAFAQASRSDTMMLIRTGGGASARLSIPRDTVVDIPGHGLQKINAAYAFGGPAGAIRIVKSYLGIPVNHVVIVNFGSFPALVDAMGGVTYTGGCVNSNISGGVANGGQTLVLPAGTHHLNGEQALVLARTRHNACNPSEDDLGRERSQQALFQDMQHQLESPSAFLRLPLVAWNAPPAIISDMSGPTLMGLFAALATGGSAPTRQLLPSGNEYLPDGSEGLSVSTAEKDRAVAQFMKG